MTIATLLDELRARPGSIVFEVRIAGVEGSDGPAVFTTGDYTLSSHTVFPGVRRITDSGAGIDRRTGLPVAGRLTVRIQPDRGEVVDGLLLRRGRRGAGWVAELVSTVEQSDDATTVTVDRSPAALPATGRIVIGQETMDYTARTEVAPYRFTIPANGRGALDTMVDRHVVTDGRPAPRVYSDPCFWTWRPVRILVSRRFPSGKRHGDMFEWRTGYLTRPPAFRGGLIELNMVNQTVASQQPIGGEDTTTTIQRGLLAIGADDPIRTVGIRLRWREGEAVNQDAGSVVNGLISDVAYRAHEEIFDVGEDERARRGDISIYSGPTGGPYALRTAPPPYIGLADGGQIQLADNTVNNAGTYIKNVECEVQLGVEVAAAGADAAIRWPGVLIDEIAANWNPGTTQNADGQWADVALSPSVPALDGGPGLLVRLNSNSHHGALDVILPSGDRERLWYLADFSDPEVDLIGVQPQPLDNVDRRDMYWWRQREIPVSLRKDDTRSGRAVIPIRGLAHGGWQTGMKYIWVTQDRFGEPPFEVNVDFEALDGSAQSTIIYIVDKVEASEKFGAGYPGWLLETDAQDRWLRHSFADFGGQPPVLSQRVRWRFTSPQVALLQLLLSFHGRRYNSSYDVLPRGGRVPQDRVMIDTFLNYTNPGAAIDLVEDFDLTRKTTIGDAIAGLLALLNAQLEQRLDMTDGKLKLALASAGAPIAADSIGEITYTRGAPEDDIARWMIGGEPGTLGGGAIANTPTFELNVGADDKPALTVSFPDSAALAENGGRIAVDRIRIPGLRVPPDPGAAEATLRPLAEARLARLGTEAVEFYGKIALVDALRIHPGATLMVSSRTTHSPKGKRPGLVREPVRVLEIKCDPSASAAGVRCWWPGFNGSGYAPALKITSSPSADKIVVAANAYTEATHPVTGEVQADLDYFEKGDRVLLVPRGRREDAVDDIVIQGIDTATRTLTLVDADNNAVVLPAVIRAAPFGTVRPTDYASASSKHKSYVFIADTNASLSGGADAFEYT